MFSYLENPKIKIQGKKQTIFVHKLCFEKELGKLKDILLRSITGKVYLNTELIM